MGMTMHVLRQDIIDENRYWTILTLRSIVGSNFRGIILPGDTVFVEDELYRHDEYAKTNGRYLIQLRARIDNGELKSGFYYILGRDEAQSI
jgi:hypothetical protein